MCQSSAFDNVQCFISVPSTLTTLTSLHFTIKITNNNTIFQALPLASAGPKLTLALFVRACVRGAAGYHWDCSDWARPSQNPLPNIMEVPGGEVRDSSSYHSNESNESVVVEATKTQPLLPPGEGGGGD